MLELSTKTNHYGGVECATSQTGTEDAERGSPACMITSVQTNKPMNDFFEIADAPGEIFDIPEMQDLYDEKKFDVEEYINGDIDY